MNRFRNGGNNMKKSVALILAFLLCVGAFLGGCTPKADTMPNEFEGIRWISYDYSFCINPADDCNGFYRFNDKTYHIKVTFDGAHLSAADTDNQNTELFYADWMYEKNDNGKETLYVHNINFNTAAYEELKTNYAEFVTLKQEEI